MGGPRFNFYINRFGLHVMALMLDIKYSIPITILLELHTFEIVSELFRSRQSF